MSINHSRQSRGGAPRPALLSCVLRYVGTQTLPVDVNNASLRHAAIFAASAFIYLSIPLINQMNASPEFKSVAKHVVVFVLFPNPPPSSLVLDRRQIHFPLSCSALPLRRVSADERRRSYCFREIRKRHREEREKKGGGKKKRRGCQAQTSAETLCAAALAAVTNSQNTSLFAVSCVNYCPHISLFTSRLALSIWIRKQGGGGTARHGTGLFFFVFSLLS